MVRITFKQFCGLLCLSLIAGINVGLFGYFFYQHVPVAQIMGRQANTRNTTIAWTNTRNTTIAWTPPTPMDVSSFTVLQQPTICSSKRNDTEPVVLWYIYNKPDNFDRRAFIRSTYANESRFPSNKLRKVFVFGRMKDETATMEKVIRKEAETYGDILYADFIEDYRNLTYKAGVLMKYVVENCQRIQYVVKSDDDTIMNIESIITTLTRHPPELLFITGMVYDAGTMPIIRDPDGGGRKWYVSPEDYGIRKPDMYPQYCSGLGFGMTFPLFKALYQRSLVEPWLWLDDAYITGVLSEHVEGITWKTVPLEIAGFHEGVDHLKKVQDGTATKIPVLLHYLNSNEEYELLTKLLLQTSTHRIL